MLFLTSVPVPIGAVSVLCIQMANIRPLLIFAKGTAHTVTRGKEAPLKTGNRSGMCGYDSRGVSAGKGAAGFCLWTALTWGHHWPWTSAIPNCLCPVVALPLVFPVSAPPQGGTSDSRAHQLSLIFPSHPLRAYLEVWGSHLLFTPGASSIGLRTLWFLLRN